MKKLSVHARRRGDRRRRARARRRHGDAAAQMGHPGAVRRLLRGQGQGLLQGRRPRRDDQARRTRFAPEQVIAGGGADVIVDWMPSRSPRARRA